MLAGADRTFWLLSGFRSVHKILQHVVLGRGNQGEVVKDIERAEEGSDFGTHGFSLWESFTGNKDGEGK